MSLLGARHSQLVGARSIGFDGVMNVRGATVALTAAASMIVACLGPGDDVAGSLSDAVAAGDVARAQALIEAGADLDLPGALGLTPLMQAANREDMEMVHLLINAGADLNATGSAGMTALHIAARTDSAEVVAALIERGADPKRRSTGGMDALADAAASGSVKVIDLFADLGMDLDAPSGVTSGGHGHPRDFGSTPLGLAVRAGQVGAVERLLQLGADVNGRSSSGTTPLLQAVYHRAPPEIVQLLLEAGADLEIRERCDAGCSGEISGSDGLTAVEWATVLDRDEILEVLTAD